MSLFPDREPVRPSEQTCTNAEQHSAIVRNERLTALVGVVLLILMMAEISLSLNLYALIPAHIFLGVLFTFPLLVKIGSTGYRFLRYSRACCGGPGFNQSI